MYPTNPTLSKNQEVTDQALPPLLAESELLLSVDELPAALNVMLSAPASILIELSRSAPTAIAAPSMIAPTPMAADQPIAPMPLVQAEPIAMNSLMQGSSGRYRRKRASEILSSFLGLSVEIVHLYSDLHVVKTGKADMNLLQYYADKLKSMHINARVHTQGSEPMLEFRGTLESVNTLIDDVSKEERISKKVRY